MAAAVSAAVEARVCVERIVWLTTVAPAGLPCVVPTWFSWDGTAFRIFTKPTARKLRNIGSNPLVMLAIGDPHADFDVVLFEGRACAESAGVAAATVDRHLAKYGQQLSTIGLDRDEYLRTYSATMRIDPTRVLSWSGRSHLPMPSPRVDVQQPAMQSQAPSHSQVSASGLPSASNPP